MTDNTGEVVTQEARRSALVERIGAFADLLCSDPLPGVNGDVAYDLLRQAAAQISSDRLRLTSTRAQVDGGAEGLVERFYSSGKIEGRDWYFEIDERPADDRIAMKAVELAFERGGGTMPISDYDIRRAREIVTGERDEIAARDAEIARLQARVAELEAGLRKIAESNADTALRDLARSLAKTDGEGGAG